MSMVEKGCWDPSAKCFCRGSLARFLGTETLAFSVKSNLRWRNWSKITVPRVSVIDTQKEMQNP